MDKARQDPGRRRSVVQRARASVDYVESLEELISEMEGLHEGQR